MNNNPTNAVGSPGSAAPTDDATILAAQALAQVYAQLTSGSAPTSDTYPDHLASQAISATTLPYLTVPAAGFRQHSAPAMLGGDLRDNHMHLADILRQLGVPLETDQQHTAITIASGALWVLTVSRVSFVHPGTHARVSSSPQRGVRKRTIRRLLRQAQALDVRCQFVSHVITSHQHRQGNHRFPPCSSTWHRHPPLRRSSSMPRLYRRYRASPTWSTPRKPSCRRSRTSSALQCLAPPRRSRYCKLYSNRRRIPLDKGTLCAPHVFSIMYDPHLLPVCAQALFLP